jgi:hypothetical protein
MEVIMCLNVNYSKTEQYKNRPKDKPILVWKVARDRDGNGILTSPFQFSKIMINPKTLEFSTKSSCKGKIDWNGEVEEGIHAFLTRESARRCRRIWFNDKIVRAYVYPKDIIAVGEHDIAAKRIYFHPEDVE